MRCREAIIIGTSHFVTTLRLREYDCIRYDDGSLTRYDNYRTMLNALREQKRRP